MGPVVTEPVGSLPVMKLVPVQDVAPIASQVMVTLVPHWMVDDDVVSVIVVVVLSLTQTLSMRSMC